MLRPANEGESDDLDDFAGADNERRDVEVNPAGEPLDNEIPEEDDAGVEEAKGNDRDRPRTGWRRLSRAQCNFNRKLRREAGCIRVQDSVRHTAFYRKATAGELSLIHI